MNNAANQAMHRGRSLDSRSLGQAAAVIADVGPRDTMKTDDETRVRPWPYLALALLSSIVPSIHYWGLNQALYNTRYPWGMHPVEILWLRDLGQLSTVLAVGLALCFILSWRMAWWRTKKALTLIVSTAFLFWVFYSIMASMTVFLQITVGNNPLK